MNKIFKVTLKDGKQKLSEYKVVEYAEEKVLTNVTFGERRIVTRIESTDENAVKYAISQEYTFVKELLCQPINLSVEPHTVLICDNHMENLSILKEKFVEANKYDYETFKEV